MADKLSDAKAVLSSANKLSSEADPTGSMKKTIAPNTPKAKPAGVPTPVSTAGGGDGGVRDLNQKVAAEEGAKVGMTAMPIMHDGGEVKKTGPAYLQKGEKVISKDKAKMQNADLGKMAGAKKSEPKADKKSAVKHKHTHIEHHDDGSHTVRHTPKGGGEEVSYSKPDLNGVIDGMHANLGQPTAASADGMQGADAAAGGAPGAGVAAPAPAPAAPAAGAPPAGM